MRYAHTHTQSTWCCQLPGSMRKAYAINSTKYQKGMQPVQTGGQGGRANKMKINCATRKKSKDFQGAHTDKQPKNISTTSSPLLLALLLLLSSPCLSLPRSSYYIFVASLSLASLLALIDNARDSHLRPATAIEKERAIHNNTCSRKV